MATILQFPTAYARVSALPEVRALRERLQPIAELAERLGTLSALETDGLRALAFAVASEDLDLIGDPEILAERLAADIDKETWKAWLCAFGGLAAQAPRER
jgi:hypothetical protein